MQFMECLQGYLDSSGLFTSRPDTDACFLEGRSAHSIPRPRPFSQINFVLNSVTVALLLVIVAIHSTLHVCCQNTIDTIRKVVTLNSPLRHYTFISLL